MTCFDSTFSLLRLASAVDEGWVTHGDGCDLFVARPCAGEEFQFVIRLLASAFVLGGLVLPSCVSALSRFVFVLVLRQGAAIPCVDGMAEEKMMLR